MAPWVLLDVLVLLLELVVEVVIFLADFVNFFSEDLDAFAVVWLSASGPEFAYSEECVLAAPALPDLPHKAVIPSTVAELAAVVNEVRDAQDS